MKKTDHILRIAISFYILIILLYGIWFWLINKYPLSNSTESWGQFGDFIGGIANPAFSLFTLIALIKTLEYTALQISLTQNSLNQGDLHNLTSVYDAAVRQIAAEYQKDLDELQELEDSGIENNRRSHFRRAVRLQQLVNLLEAARVIIQKGYDLKLELPFSDYFVWKNAAMPETFRDHGASVEIETIIFYRSGLGKFPLASKVVGA
ncbi:hypothetical protein [Leptospira licerasiae]|uniref:hypothetical protein n=1 Tax=Leptospira licerasiae TaxID=447106 RepID=UPI00143843AC|nr:hypothetical protein [Leptospira licerasiae]